MPSRVTPPVLRICERCLTPLLARHQRYCSVGCHAEDRRGATIGRQFGDLTVVAFAGKTTGGTNRYRCICKCGRQHTVCATGIQSGRTVSCSTCGIRRRVLKKGGTLIKWRGEKQSLGEIARANCMQNCTLRDRLKKGMELTKALKQPVRKNEVTCNGHRSISEAARRAGLDPDMVDARIRLGWTHKRALATPPKWQRLTGDLARMLQHVMIELKKGRRPLWVANSRDLEGIRKLALSAGYVLP